MSSTTAMMTRRSFLALAAASALAVAAPAPAHAAGVTFLRQEAPPFLPREYNASKLTYRKDTDIAVSGSIRPGESVWDPDIPSYDILGDGVVTFRNCGRDLDGDEVEVRVEYRNVRDSVEMNVWDGSSFGSGDNAHLVAGDVLEWEIVGYPGETDMTVRYCKAGTSKAARCKVFCSVYDIDVWGDDLPGYLFGGREGVRVLTKPATVYIASDTLLKTTADGVYIGREGSTDAFDWRSAAVILTETNSMSLRFSGSYCGISFAFKGAGLYPDPPVKSAKIVR